MLRKLVFLSAVGLLLTLLSPVQAQENVLWNFWFGGAINDNIANLLNDGRYPYGPDLVEYSTDFTADKPDKDYYGGRGRAYLTPPETGDYTIWVWSDDSSQVYLSTDESADNAELVASVTGWTPANAWTNYASQKGTPKPLEAGKRYYIEGVYTDGTGGGNIGVGWTGPGIGDSPVIIAGQYLTAFVDNFHPAFKPDPANGAADVTTQLFTWSAGTTAVAHDVYFGTDPNLGPDTFKGRQGFALYFALEPLTPGARYYWRIDEVEADGTTVHTGQVWTFTVMPIKAYKLSPYDGALARGLDTTLSWAAGNLAESHNLYFGTDKALVETADANALVASSLMDTTFDPNGLAAGTTFFWRVDEVQNDGTIIAGDVLSFSTATEGVHGAAQEMWLNIGGVAVSDLTSNARYPGSPDEVNVVPDFEGPTDAADNYGERLRAWVNVPAAGDYTFWVASDDASELWLGDAAWTAVKIAQVDGWAGVRAWNSNPSQQSAPIHLEAGKYFLMALMKEGGGGDNLSAAWQGGPVTQQELIIGGFLEPYVDLWAQCVSPTDNEVNVPYCTTLMWKAGVKAAAHKVYLGTDKAAVAAGDASTFQGQATDASFTPAPLRWNTTYYWKIVEVNDAEAGSPWLGPVWSFNVPDYIALVSQAETLNYDNTADPFVSEAVFEVGALSNFTARGVSKMQLEVKGNLPGFAGTPDGTFTMKAAGTDIWNNGDEFRYAYKTLTGDGSIVARVVAIGAGSNTWAKGGVMIRASLEAGSTHEMMVLTANHANDAGMGASFQGRLETNGGSSNADNTGAPIVPPYFVKIQRVGNELSGFVSPDANEWTQMGTAQTIAMADPVLVGLCVTSHAAGELRAVTFDSVVVDGNVAGDWKVADVGVDQGGNDAAPLFVALVDKAGATKAVAHASNPNAVLDPNWSSWTIPMSSFAGVNLADVNQLIVRVGDGTADGDGSIQFRNVRLTNPTSFSIPVANASFEQPGGPDQFWYRSPERARSLGGLPGWSTDKATTATGFIKNAEPTKGSWSAYISNGNPLWQLTNHVALEGEVFQLDVDALVIMGGVRDAMKNLKLSLYYLDDAGKRVSIGSASTTLPYDPQPRSLTVKASDVRACIGRKVGIEFSNLRSDNVIGVDNVRLKVK